MLPHSLLEQATIRRSESQRVSETWPSEGLGVGRAAYRLGHYVPNGSRSRWTMAQYIIYKEEQAAWRRNRHVTRLIELTRMSANGLRQQNGAPTSNEDLFGVAQHSKSEKTHFRLDRSFDSHLSHMGDNPSRTEDLQGKMNAFHWILLTWTVDDSLCFEAWEAPESEASEEEDDYQWLRQRGFRSPHDYSPSSMCR